MVAVQVTNVFGTTDSIVAAELNQNFDDIEAALSELDSTNLSDSAGIRATQLADRYTISESSMVLVPNTSSTALISDTTSNANQFTFSAEMASGAYQTLFKRRVTLDSGQEAYLCEVELYIHRKNAVGSSDPQFQYLKNGVIVGGAGVTIDADDDYKRLRNLNPTDSPLISLADGDEIEYQFAESGASGATIAGVVIREVVKTRLTN